MSGSAAVRPKVSGLAIEVTAHCQQKCGYCYNAWREDDGARLARDRRSTPEQLLARVDKVLGALDVGHVTVTGGEPFARRDVFDLLDLLEARGVGVRIISNGGLVDDDVASRLARHRVSFVQVTLQGPSAALHEEHVGQGHFEPTLRGIRALVARGVPVVGCIVVTRKNASQVGAILEVFRSLGVREVALSRFSPAGYAAQHAADLLPSRDDLLGALRLAVPFAKAEGATEGSAMRVTCTMPVPPCAIETEQLAPLSFGTCAIGTSMQEFVLGSDGRMRLCTLHEGGLGGAGGRDVLDDDVDPAALVTGAEVTSYRRDVPDFCRGCTHATTCAGGCGAAARSLLGSRALPDPFVWQHVDDTFAARLEADRQAAPHRRMEVVK